MIFKYPCSRALNASILSKTLWVYAFRYAYFSRPSSKTPGWRRFCPKTYSYVHNTVLIYIYIFPKGNSAQAEVLPETCSYIHKHCAYMYIFP
ncbi:hypothetical protein Taro_012394 [Colocasia esculenta]|uniref:Uncharacterized protein n=1 Tax=Colocasia esculenta TaxID=4460 RepID=A0A843UDE0_COLES|nr:hypothetical protein [Colocasia esculenta]